MLRLAQAECLPDREVGTVGIDARIVAVELNKGEASVLGIVYDA
jgi:hypothetical protein